MSREASHTTQASIVEPAVGEKNLVFAGLSGIDPIDVVKGGSVNVPSWVWILIGIILVIVIIRMV